MGFNYFPELNRYFKSLYYRNQAWFKYRDDLSQAEQQRLFQAFLKMDDGLREVSRIFLQKEQSTAGSDAQKQ